MEAETWRDAYGKQHVDYAALVRDIAAALKDLKQMTTERDGYAAELKTITEEANTQRKAADDAKAALKLASASLESLKTTHHAFNADIQAAFKKAMDQERRAGWVETWVAAAAAVFIGVWVGILIGRFGR